MKILMVYDACNDIGYYRFASDDEILAAANEVRGREDTCPSEPTCAQHDADSLERRVSDLEVEIETLFASDREHHPATRPAVKKSSVGPDFTPEEMGYEPDVKMAPNKHTCPLCGTPVTVEGEGSTHWYKPVIAPAAPVTERFMKAVMAYKNYADTPADGFRTAYKALSERGLQNTAFWLHSLAAVLESKPDDAPKGCYGEEHGF